LAAIKATRENKEEKSDTMVADDCQVNLLVPNFVHHGSTQTTGSGGM
jgi:hypothetical protein